MRGGKRKGAGAKKKENRKVKYFTFRTDAESKEKIKNKFGKSFVKMFNEWKMSVLG